MAGMNSLCASNFLKLLLQAVPWANVADNAAGAPITNTYASLHSADPANGNQSANELAYTGYARQAIARTAGGWNVASNAANPVANIVFPQSSGGTPTATHWGIGKTVSGATDLWFSGTVTPNIVVSTTQTQTITNGSTLTLT